MMEVKKPNGRKEFESITITENDLDNGHFSKFVFKSCVIRPSMFATWVQQYFPRAHHPQQRLFNPWKLTATFGDSFHFFSILKCMQ